MLGGASLVGLAGCASDSSQYEDLQGPVPEAYRSATSLGGTERNANQLQPKSAVSYQSQRNSQACENCVHYIPDMNDDGLGACSLVEGYIEPDAWCTIYAKHTE